MTLVADGMIIIGGGMMIRDGSMSHEVFFFSSDGSSCVGFREIVVLLQASNCHSRCDLRWRKDK